MTIHLGDHLWTKGDNDEIAAFEIQQHAARRAWGGVAPLTQQRVRFRGFMREAVTQKRGPAFFALAYDHNGRPHVVGPMPRRLEAARQAIAASRKADLQ